MINFVVALPCEARPIIDHYKLESVKEANAFKVYQKDHISLVISGVGKMMAAAASSYLYVIQGQEDNQGWINVGIAGHQSHSIGAAFVAHRVIDQGSEKSWYPVFIENPSCLSETVQTVEKAEKNYQKPYLYEMEASGFFSTAYRFSSAELIHALKIVSDNQKNPFTLLKAKDITHLIQQRIDLIVSLEEELSNIVKELRRIHSCPKGYQNLVEQHHFTASQQRILHSLLQKMQTLNLGSDKFLEELIEKRNAREIIRAIEYCLQTIYHDEGQNVELKLEKRSQTLKGQ